MWLKKNQFNIFLLQELNKLQAQLEYSHGMLLRHHESTQDLEYKHQAAIHRLRDDQMRKQHHTELANQKEYTERVKRELKRKHATEVKNQPRSLRVCTCPAMKDRGESCVPICV